VFVGAYKRQYKNKRLPEGSFLLEKMNKDHEILINGSPLCIEVAPSRLQLRVGCLGPAGTYTETARHNLLGDYLSQMESKFLPSNSAVIQKVEDGELDLGVVPVENSTEGDVVEVLRELNYAKRVRILAETILGIKHSLIGRLGVSLEQIRSHPQALAQCRSFLLKNYPTVSQQQSLSTTAAVEAAVIDNKIAAIASSRAAEIYGLSTIAEDIGDIVGNSTRFLVIGRGETSPTGYDATALIFTPVNDQVGILAKCLTLFSSYGINLTKIDSRPTGALREYDFLVTLDGHIQDSAVKGAVTELRTKYCPSLRVLGSYRRSVGL